MRKPALLALALTLVGCQDVTHPAARAADRPEATTLMVAPAPVSVQIDGPLEITQEGGYVFTAQVEGGSSTHPTTFQWYIRWDRDNGYVRPLGTGSTQQVNVIASEGNFMLFVAVESEGATATDHHYVTNLMTCGQDYCPVDGTS